MSETETQGQDKADLELAKRFMEAEWEITQLKVRLETLSRIAVDLINEKLLDDNLPIRQRYLLTDIRKVLRKTTTEERKHG